MLSPNLSSVQTPKGNTLRECVALCVVAFLGVPWYIPLNPHVEVAESLTAAEKSSGTSGPASR
jgi:hypothetical protein